MAIYELKLNNSPNQSSIVQIPIDGATRVFKIDLSYREICGYWTLSIMDWKAREEILTNIPLVTGKYLDGAGDSLLQFKYKRLGSFGVCRTTRENTTDYPNDKNLGTEFTFFWRID